MKFSCRTVAALVFLLPAVAFASYVSTVAADSPVDFWYLDEPSGTMVTDHGSLNRTVTYQATPTLDQPCLLSGYNCPLFDGTTHYGTTSTSAGGAPSANHLSVECLVNMSTTSGNQTAMSSQDGAGCASCGCYTNVFLFGVFSSKVEVDIGQGACATYMSSSGSTSVSTNAWHQIVGTFNHTTPSLKTYLDGVIDSTSTTTTGSPVTSSERIFLAAYGGSNTSPAYLLPGYMQMCSVFTAELSAGQVLAHYNAIYATDGIMGRRIFQSRRTVIDPYFLPVSFGVREPEAFSLDVPTFVIDQLNRRAIRSREVYAH